MINSRFFLRFGRFSQTLIRPVEKVPVSNSRHQRQYVTVTSLELSSAPESPRALKDWKLGRLNHVAIAVPDLEKARSLYRDVLGGDISDTVVC